jgi:1-acyl-sn-glycerol-3-phosphate acyltransferase
LRYAVDLIVKQRQLVVFPEGKINKYGKNIVLKQGLFRLARLAKQKATSITIIPIGIAYSEVTPKFRGNVSLCFGEPLIISENINFSINEFNKILHEKMTVAENEALKIVGR